MVEVVVVTVTIGLLVAIAFPSLVGALTRARVAAARDAFASAHRLARQVAAQYGQIAKLHVDPDGNKFWVTVDTGSAPGREVEDTIQPVVDLGAQFGGVRITSNRRLICFSIRALGTASGRCELPNATLVFRSGDAADTVTISRAGRLLKR